MTLEVVRGVDDAKGNVFGWKHVLTSNARGVPTQNT